MGKGAFKRDAQDNVLLDDKGAKRFNFGADGRLKNKVF